MSALCGITFWPSLTQINRLVREESKIFIRGILLDVGISRAEQCDEHVDEDDSRQEVPGVVYKHAGWVAVSLRGGFEIRGTCVNDRRQTSDPPQQCLHKTINDQALSA